MKGWRCLNNYNSDTSGRIWVLWNPHVLDVDALGEMGQSLHCSIKVKDLNSVFSVSFIYGANVASARSSLWADLVTQSSSIGDRPWMVLGDFNAVRFPNERWGGSLDWSSSLEDCNEACLAAGLDDLRYSGIHFSWRKGRSTTMRKLDRVMINNGWMSSFPHSFAEFCSYGISDHASMVVSIGVDLPLGKKSFKFFNHWVDFDEFFPTVERAWNVHFDGYKMFQVYQKLKEVKKALKILCAQKKTQCEASLSDLRAELSSYQLQIDSIGPEDDLLAKELDCLKRLRDLSSMEESSAKQKSRVQWLKEGDQIPPTSSTLSKAAIMSIN